MLVRSLLVLSLCLHSEIALADREEREEEEHGDDDRAVPREEEDEAKERRGKADRDERKGVQDWEKQATFDESVLAPRSQVKTATLAAPETDVGLSLGARELGVEPSDRPLATAVRLGPAVIQTQIYLSLIPEVSLFLDAWRVTFQAPLNLLLLQPGTNTFGQFALRARDWDQVTDYVQILRSLELTLPGMKLAVDAFTPRTLLYGHLISAYQPSLDLDHPSTGVAFRFDRKFVAVEAVIADVTFDRPILGAAATLRPFELIGASRPQIRSLGLSLEIATDLRAPSCVRPNGSETRCVRAVGNRGGVDPETLELRDDTFVTTSRDDGLPFVNNTNVTGTGAVIGTQLYRSAELLIESRASWHTLFGGGHGFAVGVVVAGLQHRAVRAEVRLLTDRFVFGYFDTLYEVEKIESFARADSTELAPTRYQAVFGDESAAVETVAKGVAFGYRLAGSWQFFAETPVTLTAGLENTSRESDTKIYFHADFRAFERIHIFGTLLRLGADAGKSLARAQDQGGLVLLSGARARISDNFAISARYAYLQALGHAPGGEIHLGDKRIAADLRYSREQIFEPQHTVALEVALRWEVL